MRSESLSAFLGYMPSQRDRCPLQRRLLTGEKSNSGHETSRESEMRIVHFKTDALKFEIVRNTRLLKRKCGHSRNHTLRFPLRCRGVFLLFTLPTVWLVSIFLSESEPPPSRLGKLCRRLQAAEMLPYRLVA